MKTQLTTLKQLSCRLVLPLFGLGLIANAQASVIFSDDFSDGNRDGWFSNTPNRAITVNESNNLVMPEVGYGTEAGSFITYFDSTTLAVGQTLTMSYAINNVSINSSPVRIGLFDSKDSQIDEDNDSFTDTTFNSYAGYIASINMSAGNNGQYLYTRNTNNSLWTTGSTVFNISEDFDIPANQFIDASISIYRLDATTAEITISFGDNSVTGSHTTSNFTFDTIGFLFGKNASGERQFGSFEVSVIPEPAHYAAFFGLGVLSLVIIRRRRA